MYNVGFGMRMTPAVKNLILANVAVFVGQMLLPQFINAHIFGLVPRAVVGSFSIWQLVTYMFLHGDFWHIFFNMFILWMFGIRLEGTWGTQEFLKYYFLTGVAAGVANVFWNFGSPIPTIGASGAVYGLLAAYALFYPEEPIYLYFLFPIKAKYLVLIFAVIEFLSAYSQDGIAHIAHLGGMVAGFFYIKHRYRHWGVGRDFFKDFFKKKDSF
jgi:membrane associated rhomboid family serine protease